MKKRRKSNPIKSAMRKRWTELSKRLRQEKPYCEKCGKSADECRLNVHHILPRRLYPQFMFEEKNLINLCPKCHSFCSGSAHKDGTAFTIWFMKAFPERFSAIVDMLQLITSKSQDQVR